MSHTAMMFSYFGNLSKKELNNSLINSEIRVTCQNKPYKADPCVFSWIQIGA